MCLFEDMLFSLGFHNDLYVVRRANKHEHSAEVQRDWCVYEGRAHSHDKKIRSAAHSAAKRLRALPQVVQLTLCMLFVSIYLGEN